MIRLNLLPHRELRKAQQIKQFYVVLGVVLAASAAFAFGGYQFLDLQIANQNNRNNYLQSKIDVLSKQIEDIQTLKKERDSLLARKKVVEKLQTSRSEVVRLMDQLTRLTPEGIYLTSIKQTDATVNLVGMTQSNARVSTFIRNIENSTFLTSPRLIEIARSQADSKLNQFSMTLEIKRESEESVASGAKG
ncbi:PilN domain-containing protein [Leeia sp. TBRC 13508]|uniref:PilN domain-containing protein n=1 Tax=Leeia speluncae TaxID=2884804 RepID=A0ABS8D2Z0_9NEIS|nr:PilN domain-containing protein [Leeia speluncae]MCB6182552.1 PilN domain-containing protein [Leeia speluncae]